MHNDSLPGQDSPGLVLPILKQTIMKLFKTLLLLVVCTTTFMSCEPEALEAIENNLKVQAHKNKKDIIDDKKDIDNIRDAIPNSIDSIMIN